MRPPLHYTCLGNFESYLSEGFVYLSSNPESNQILFIIKGLYGYFDPEESSSFTNLLLEQIHNTHHVIIGNSSRKFVSTSNESEPFEGKSMQQELQDVQDIFREGLSQLEHHNQISDIHIWGHSFGGTLAIQLPDILDKTVKSVTIMNSPSGANSQTKPLLKDLTIQPEEVTLQYIRQFTGVFNLIQGGQDTVVPLKSGEKIFEQAERSHQKNHFLIRDMDHRGYCSITQSYAISNILRILDMMSTV